MLLRAALLLLATSAGLVLRLPARRTRQRTSPAMAMQWQTALGSADENWRTALSTTLANITVSEDTSLALLFVSQAHASHLREACSEVVQALSPEVLVGVVGAGVAGAGSELEGEPVFSVLAGALPEHTALRPFLMTTDSMPNWPSLDDSVPEGSRPSFLLFADPFSPIMQAVNCLDDAFPASVVAGGLSCPTSESAPSLALYTRGALPRVLPSGSVLGLVLGGPRLEVHTAHPDPGPDPDPDPDRDPDPDPDPEPNPNPNQVHTACAQGASPVGPTFTVTAGQDNLVEALDGAPALERLQQVAQQAASSDERLLRLLQRALLVGLPVRAGDGVDDFLIRQVAGATPAGGLVLGGERVVAGETQLRFFVRDEIASDADLRLVLDRCAPRPPRPPSRPARPRWPHTSHHAPCDRPGGCACRSRGAPVQRPLPELVGRTRRAARHRTLLMRRAWHQHVLGARPRHAAVPAERGRQPARRLLLQRRDRLRRCVLARAER